MRIDWDRIHFRRGAGPLTPILAAGSTLYCMGLRLHQAFIAIRKPESLPGFVVSIGNLTAGGTGKTPGAAMLAQWAQGLGCRPVILSRGYGRTRAGAAVEVLDGRKPGPDPDRVGDEPCLLSRLVPGVPVVVSGSRHTGGLYAHEVLRSDFFILDDGFQHRMLRRDLDIVLLDAKDPLGNGRLLPWGPLREPLCGLERADALVLTRCGEGDEGPGLELAGRFPEKPVFRSRHAALEAVFPGRRLRKPPVFLQGKRVAAFSGIARPGVFCRTLERLGAEVVEFRAFRDHHRFTREELDSLKSLRDASEADCLITTEKDWVRAERILAADPAAGFLRIGMEMIPDSGPFFSLVRGLSRRSGVLPEEN